MTKQDATFAAGCFWGVEETFRHIKGVLSTEVGYTDGTTQDPSYEEVCNTQTGHAEAVHLIYDDSTVSYADLLAVFWKDHDPTTLNRQGLDIGSQYRSAIFFHTPQQEKIARKSLEHEQKKYKKQIVTQLVEAPKFYRAEEYHQRYVEKKAKKKFESF